MAILYGKCCLYKIAEHSRVGNAEFCDHMCTNFSGCVSVTVVNLSFLWRKRYLEVLVV